MRRCWKPLPKPKISIVFNLFTAFDVRRTPNERKPMLKRILIALAITFSAVQAAQACSTCGCRDKKDAAKHDHDHDHGEEGHSHGEEAKTADADAKVKAIDLKTSGTLSQVKKTLQFKAADGKVYTVNKKLAAKVTPLLGKKVDIVAKAKKNEKTGKLVISTIKSVLPAKS